MPLHMIKLCVGADSVEDLTRWQSGRLKTVGEIAHTTRMIPKRSAEIIDGGSLYWVIKGFVQVRQRVAEIRPFTDHDGIRRCDLVLHKEITLTEPVPRRPFQGWRYLKPEDAPRDLDANVSHSDDMPATMRAELRELGLL